MARRDDFAEFFQPGFRFGWFFCQEIGSVSAHAIASYLLYP